MASEAPALGLHSFRDRLFGPSLPHAHRSLPSHGEAHGLSVQNGTKGTHVFGIAMAWEKLADPLVERVALYRPRPTWQVSEHGPAENRPPLCLSFIPVSEAPPSVAAAAQLV